MKLTFDIYRGTTYPPAAAGPFGLRSDQMRSAPVLIQNAGWYNRCGEFLGYGDLAPRDFQRISSEIDEDEIFFVLHEGYWRMPSQAKKYLRFGLEHVFHVADYIITRGHVHLVANHAMFGPRPGQRHFYDGLEIPVIARYPDANPY